MKGMLGNIMQQAQQAQEEMKKAQSELAELRVQGESGGGMVKVLMTGKHELVNIDIDSVVLQEDKEMLQDLVVAAVNNAVSKVEKEVQSKYSDMLGGIQLPAGIKLPF